MKFRKQYALVSILALFLAVTSSAFAGPANSDENKSVYSWGPWEKMVSPAAGPVHAEKTSKSSSSFSDMKEQKKDDKKTIDSTHE